MHNITKYFKCLALVFLFTTGIKSLQGQVLWYGDPNRNYLQSFYRLSTEPGEFGTISTVTDAQYGNVWSINKPSGSKRAEFARTEGTVNFYTPKEGDLLYIGWRVKVNVAGDQYAGSSMFQWKSNNGGDQNYPFVMGMSTTGISMSAYTPGTGPQYLRQKPLFNKNVLENTWVSIIIGVKVSGNDQVGYLEVWIDGAKQQLTGGNANGRFMHRTLDLTGNYCKWGAYDEASRPYNITQYFDEMRIGKTYADVATPLGLSNTITQATITASTNAFCTGGSSTLTANNGASYKWFNGTTQVGTAKTYTATTGGNYKVEVTYNSGSKSTSAVTTITVNALPTAAITSPTNSFCTGGSVVLTSSTGTSYKWFNGTTQVGTGATYTATAAGSYTVEVTNASGCKATSPAKVITVNPLPVITYNVNANGNWTAASTATVCATTNVIVGPWPVVETGWNWTGPNNFTATTREIYLNNTQANQSGIYTATYRDANGCVSSGTFNLQVNAATIWYADTDNDGKGNPLVTLSSCTKPAGYVAVAGDACPTDATKFTPGNCGCNKTENSCLDCAGVANGTAIIDACGKCAGGTTGIPVTTNPNQCITTTVPSISGPLCVATGIKNNYVFNSGNLSIASINWWTNSGATVTQNPANAKQAQINFPAYANGTNATITAGVNLNTAPWYQEFTLLVKVGGCTGSTPQLRASATPLPFNALTTVSLDNNEIINSVRVVDMNGVEVFNQNNINKNSFELGAELPSGMYIAYVTSSKGTSIVKLVKNN